MLETFGFAILTNASELGHRARGGRGGAGRGGGGLLNITLIGADVHVGLPSGVQKVEKRGVFDPFLGLRGP